MNSILLFKKDLDRYSTDSLETLQRYFDLPAAKRTDLLWLLAIYQAQNNRQGTMNGAAQPLDEDAVERLIQVNVLEKECNLDKNIITIPAGTTLYRGVTEDKSQLSSTAEHWAIPDSVVRQALEAANLIPILTKLGCDNAATRDDYAKAHAQVFANAKEGQVYEYKTTVPLKLVLICECLNRLAQGLYAHNINLADDDQRRLYYCRAERILKDHQLDGYLGLDAGAHSLYKDPWEVFICAPNKKLELVGKLDEIINVMDYMGV